MSLIYNPVYKRSEQVYVPSSPDELSTLLNSINLETLQISTVEEKQPAPQDKVPNPLYYLTITNTDKTIQLYLRTVKDWSKIARNKPFYYVDISIARTNTTKLLKLCYPVTFKYNYQRELQK